MERTFPGREWARQRPEEVGFSSERLAAVEAWLHRIAEGEPFRLVIARHGYLAAEWGQGVDVEEALGQASASKSYFSCILGIAVAEGKIPSPDARVCDYYPEMVNDGRLKPPACPCRTGRDVQRRPSLLRLPDFHGTPVDFCG
jgi:CubicO group peptidase (beta-lactamase class C family)